MLAKTGPIGDTLLRCESIEVKFGGLYALAAVNLTVSDGIHGVIGPNGAGKTTLFNVLTGITRPTSGKVFFREEEISRLPAHRVAGMGVARTFQNIRLFERMTVVENILVGRHRHFRASIASVVFKRGRIAQEEREALEKALQLARYVGLDGLENHLASELSYGHKRRLEIARALAIEPHLLLLDEPMAGMNPAEKSDLATLITRIQHDGPAILLIEHDMKVMMTMCGRLTVLHHGRTIGDGTPSEIRANQAVVEAYLGDGGKAVASC